MKRFFIDVVIVFIIFFFYLMYAGETTIMEGIVASLAAGWFFGLLVEMFVAIISVVREIFNSWL